MHDEAAADSESPSSPRRPRRAHGGLIRRALRLAGAAGDAADAAIVLGTAEAELSRAALPYLAFWFCVSLLFGISLVACAWTGAVLGLTTLTGSVPMALGIMALVSLVLLAVSALYFRRLLRWASFPESRRRLMALLHSLGYGRESDARRRTP